MHTSMAKNTVTNHSLPGTLAPNIESLLNFSTRGSSNVRMKAMVVRLVVREVLSSTCFTLSQPLGEEVSAALFDETRKAVLVDAVGSGHVLTTQRLLGMGVCANLIVPRSTLLHLGIESGTPAVVEVLLKAAADPNAMLPQSPYTACFAENNGSSMPLHDAVKKRYLDMVRMLLRAFADPNARYVQTRRCLVLRSEKPSHETPLHLATNLQFQKQPNRKSQGSSRGSYFGAPDFDAATLVAITDIVDALLCFRADPNVMNMQLRTPLHNAAQVVALYGGWDLHKKLLKAGADAKAIDSDCKTSMDLANEVWLLDAVQNGKANAAVRLLKMKTDPNTKLEVAGGQTALCLMMKHGQWRLLEDLLAARADPNAGTPMTIPVKQGYHHQVEILLAARADPNASGFLEDAYKSDQPGIVRMLLKSRADPNHGYIIPVQYKSSDHEHSDDDCGQFSGHMSECMNGSFFEPPLYLAAEKNDHDMVAELLGAQADPNITFLDYDKETCNEFEGHTPFQYVMRKARFGCSKDAHKTWDIARLLLDARADAEVQEKQDFLHHAVEIRDRDLVTALLNAGASPNNALHLAVHNGDRGLVNDLLEAQVNPDHSSHRSSGSDDDA